MPQISVIIPAKDAGWCIGSTLNAFRRQTYRDFEVIVCNDHSTDDTRKIVSLFAGHDKRFKLCDSPSESAGAARNHGFSLASGEFVVFFDADDKPDADYLESFSDAFAGSKVDCVLSGCSFGNVAGETLSRRETSCDGYLDKIDFCVGTMTGQFSILSFNIAFRQSMLRKFDIKFLEGVDCFEDLPFWLESALVSRRVRSIVSSHAKYVKHQRQMTKQTVKLEDQFYCERTALHRVRASVRKLRGYGELSSGDCTFLTRFIDEVMFPHLLIKHMSFCLKRNDTEKYYRLYESKEAADHIFNCRKSLLLFKYFKNTWMKVVLLNINPRFLEHYYLRGTLFAPLFMSLITLCAAIK